jgi:hypothetical protein
MGETEIETLAISKKPPPYIGWDSSRGERPEPLVSLADRYPTVGWKIEAG